MEYNCGTCGRAINHRGNCFPCNKRAKKARMDSLAITNIDEISHGREEGDLGSSDTEKKDFVFPFAVIRDSQREMITDVHDAVTSGRHLIADAPTGLGKTVAALYPAVNYAVQNGKTVFFLTSRLSQHRAAIDTLKAMKMAGNSFFAVDIIGKKHLCSQDVEGMDSQMFGSFCSSMIKFKRCAFYKSFHNPNLALEKSGLLRLVRSRSPLNSEEAKKLVYSRFCAFEMLCEASKSADVIVGDYFHLFGSADTFLKRTGRKLEDIIIIVDEGHNLAPRLRSHMSSKLSTRICELATREATRMVEQESKSIAKNIGKALEQMGKKHLFNEQEAFASRDGFMELIKDYEGAITALRATGERVLKGKKISFAARIADFLERWKENDFGYSRILSRERLGGSDHIALQFNCMDPSLVSREIIAKSHCTILMSGTLSPMEMHRDLLGMEAARTEMKSYESPFPRENRRNIIATGITTQYRQRTPENMARMASVIRQCIEAVCGNVAVFFPSYEMRDHIHDIMGPAMRKHTILERSETGKEEKDRLKDEMRAHSVDGAVLLAIMGGSFSEGIDLPGDLLNGVIVLGLPLERPSLSSQALIDYYEKRFARGRDYGYNFPAMIKVMQAAGRCIRSEKDRGVIVFADERFTWKNYRNIFPKSWEFVVTRNPENEVKKFFHA